jgi:hypothetical protein
MAGAQNAFDMQIKLLMIGDSGKFFGQTNMHLSPPARRYLLWILGST